MGLASVTDYPKMRERRRHKAKLIAADSIPGFSLKDWHISAEKGKVIEFTSKDSRQKVIVNVPKNYGYIVNTFFGYKIRVLEEIGVEFTLLEDEIYYTIIEWGESQASVFRFWKQDGSHVAMKRKRDIHQAIRKGKYVLLERTRIYQKEEF